VIRIVPLDRTGMSRWLDDLVRLDARLFQTMGRAYAETGWTAEQFQRELDGKWALSLAAIDRSRTLAGFCIASASRHGAVHIHRLAVEPRCQGRGVGRSLIAGLERLAWLSGERTQVTVAASAAGSPAVAIYRHLGFEMLHGENLQAFAARLNRTVRFHGDRLEELHGQSFHVFRKLVAVTPGPDVSIVFLTFNTSSLLRRALETVHRDIDAFGGPVEVIVVDNHSEDGTEAMVRRLFPAVRYHRTDRNLGSAAGRNVGIRMAGGAYVALLDSDTFIEASALRTMREFLAAHRDYAAVSCKLTFADGRHHPTHSVFPSLASELFTALFLHKLAPGRLARAFTLHGWRYTENREVDWVGLGCSMVSWIAVQGVGLLDEEFFYTGEDVDWCYRARLAGWKTGIVVGAQAVHVGGQSIKKNIGAIFDKPFRGKLRFFEKHHGHRTLPLVRAVAILDAVTNVLAWAGIFFLRPARRERARSFIRERVLLLRALVSRRI
jgi:hypothetical protein